MKLFYDRAFIFLFDAWGTVQFKSIGRFKKEMVILSLMIMFSVLLSAMFSGGGMVVIIGIVAVVMLGWGMKFFIPEFRQF